MLEKTLELDAVRRISAEQALAHPYLQVYSDPQDEPNSTPYDQTFEDLDLSVEQWKGTIQIYLRDIYLILLNLKMLHILVLTADFL